MITGSLARLFVMAALAAACGSPAAVATPTPTQSATATPTPTPSAAIWIVTDKSKATVRVREQLVGVSLPSDAVLTVTGAKGSFELKADGSFSSASKITLDLTTIVSDERNRDNFIKRDPLSVSQFPSAEFVPTKVTGLTLPLAASGSFTFKLIGTMTIHGTTKEVTFDVQASRNGGDLTATATANPTWKFADFGMSPPSSPFRVVSVTDEIRLVIDLVATGPGA